MPSPDQNEGNRTHIYKWIEGYKPRGGECKDYRTIQFSILRNGKHAHIEWEQRRNAWESTSQGRVILQHGEHITFQILFAEFEGVPLSNKQVYLAIDGVYRSALDGSKIDADINSGLFYGTSGGMQVSKFQVPRLDPNVMKDEGTIVLEFYADIEGHGIKHEYSGLISLPTKVKDMKNFGHESLSGDFETAVELKESKMREGKHFLSKGERHGSSLYYRLSISYSCVNSSTHLLLHLAPCSHFFNRQGPFKIRLQAERRNRIADYYPRDSNGQQNPSNTENDPQNTTSIEEDQGQDQLFEVGSKRPVLSNNSNDEILPTSSSVKATFKRPKTYLDSENYAIPSETLLRSNSAPQALIRRQQARETDGVGIDMLSELARKAQDARGAIRMKVERLEVKKTQLKEEMDQISSELAPLTQQLEALDGTLRHLGSINCLNS